MNKRGVLNPYISSVIAGMGHGDMLVIGDAGLPVPEGVSCIDVSVIAGIPRFTQVLTAVLGDLAVEKAYIASEMAGQNPAVYEEAVKQLDSIAIQAMSHEELKVLSDKACVVIRTGECTPFANVILVAGVTF